MKRLHDRSGCAPGGVLTRKQQAPPISPITPDIPQKFEMPTSGNDYQKRVVMIRCATA